MDNLEKYIRENAAAFDVEPNSGHFDRFEQKLKEQSGLHRRRLIHRSMRVAAVGVLLIMSGLFVGEHFFSSDVSQDIPVTQEYQQAQFYYKTRIDDGLSTIKNLQGGISDEQRQMLLDELSNVDSLFQQLQEDYKASPDDPRIMEALLRHYRMKAEVIDNIVKDLEKCSVKEQRKVQSSVSL